MRKKLSKGFKGLEEFVIDQEVEDFDKSPWTWLVLLENILKEFNLRSRLLYTNKTSLKLYDEEREFIEHGLSYKKGATLRVEDIFSKGNIIHTNYEKKPIKFLVPVVWQVASTMHIEADSYEEAMHIAIHKAKLPEDGEYLCDSLVIDEDSAFFGQIAD